tara:strand:- start:654 stop:884 length:231 start_codon:yes stop_codon:yes gene_type:complete
MKTFHVECMETTTFIVEVEAQSEDEARDLVNSDVNNYEVIHEEVLDYEINLIEEVDNNDDDNVTSTMQTFIPGFHD